MFKHDIWFILGLSGAGKTYFSEYVAQQKNWLHLNIDQPYKIIGKICGDGIDIFKLRPTWEIFEKEKNIEPLVDEITKQYKCSNKAGAVLSFPSNKIIQASDVKILEQSIKVVYLYSSINNCRSSFIQREKTEKQPRVLYNQSAYWQKHNQLLLETLSTLSHANYNLVDTFNRNNTRKLPQQIYREINNHA